MLIIGSGLGVYGCPLALYSLYEKWNQPFIGWYPPAAILFMETILMVVFFVFWAIHLNLASKSMTTNEWARGKFKNGNPY